MRRQLSTRDLNDAGSTEASCSQEAQAAGLGRILEHEWLRE